MDLLSKYLNRHYSVDGDKIYRESNVIINGNLIVSELNKVFSLPNNKCLEKTIKWLKINGKDDYFIDIFFCKYTATLNYDDEVILLKIDSSTSKTNCDYADFSGNKFFTRKSHEVTLNLVLTKEESSVLNRLNKNIIRKFSMVVTTFHDKSISSNMCVGCLISAINTSFLEDGLKVELNISVDNLILGDIFSLSY